MTAPAVEAILTDRLALPIARRLVNLAILRYADSIEITTAQNPGLLRARFGPLYVGSFYNRAAETDGWIQVTWQISLLRFHYEIWIANRILRRIPS